MSKSAFQTSSQTKTGKRWDSFFRDLKASRIHRTHDVVEKDNRGYVGNYSVAATCGLHCRDVLAQTGEVLIDVNWLLIDKFSNANRGEWKLVRGTASRESRTD
jgi:hypothetical protein